MLRRQLDFIAGWAQARDMNLRVAVNKCYSKELKGQKTLEDVILENAPA